MGKEEKVLRIYGPGGGINPHVAARVKFNNSPSVFAVVDEYCLNPEFGCRDVTLGFYEVEGNVFEKLHFKILVDVDTWEIKEQHILIEDLDCEAMIEEFIRDVDKPTKSRIRKRFETDKQYSGDQLRQDLDPTAYEYGESIPYAEVFDSTHYPMFTFDHSGVHYCVLDRYCIDPGCNCDDVLLEFHSQEKEDAFYRLIFEVRLSFKTGKHIMEGKYGNLKNKELEEIYLHFMNNICSINEEHDLDFKLLKDRYDRMKKVNLVQSSAETERSDRSKQSSKKAVTVKAGRNDPCPCGSGKKFKRCCLSKSVSDPGRISEL